MPNFILFKNFISSEERQTVLFSATQTKKTEDLARLSLNEEPIYVGVDDGKEHATVDGLNQVRFRSNVMSFMGNYLLIMRLI